MTFKAPKWQEASAFAHRAHEYQKRKDGRTPYSSHVTRVALTIATVFGETDETIIAAALLHDTIEDTTADYDKLVERFGRDVADLVVWMTKDMTLAKDDREPAYDQRLAEGPWQARLLKLADVYDNLIDTPSEKKQREAIDKARRAIDLAEGDPELKHARKIVTEAVRHFEQKLG